MIDEEGAPQMKYMMFVATDTDPDSGHESDGDMEEWFADANGRGKWVMGDRLAPADDARTVRVRSGQVLVTDGPFTESKECIAGFDILECNDIEEAIDVAARHPMARFGRIELRAFWPIEG
jgi:hypothetical protein